MTNTGTYAYEDLPAFGDDQTSRYALPVFPSGRGGAVAEVVALAYERLNAVRLASAAELEAPTAAIALKRVHVENGAYTLHDRGLIAGTQLRQATRPGKFAAATLSGGALLDAVMAGEAPDVRDDAVWEALRVTAEQTRATGRGLRLLNDAVAIALALRVGIVVSAAQLPGVN